MYGAMHHYFPTQDIVIKAAAVADYRPKLVYDQKMKKQTGDWYIEMERTKDILQSLGEIKNKQFLVGFAAETANPLAYGMKKLDEKHLDAIVDRKSTRLNSSHVAISYAVFCLKKK